MNEILHIVDDKPSKRIPELTDDEKRICDMVLCGESGVRAYMEAYGIVAKDRKEYLKYSSKASRFLATKKAQKYMAAHRKVVRIIVEQDMEALASHMYDIAMGNAKKEIAHYDKDLKRFVKDEISPAHSDQIAAAAWMKNWYDDKRKTQLVDITAEQNQKQAEVANMANEFISMFSMGRIQDGVFKDADAKNRELEDTEAILDMRGELDDTVEVKSENVRKMISSFTSGDDEITDRIMENYARS